MINVLCFDVATLNLFELGFGLGWELSVLRKLEFEFGFGFEFEFRYEFEFEFAEVLRPSNANSDFEFICMGIWVGLGAQGKRNEAW